MVELETKKDNIMYLTALTVMIQVIEWRSRPTDRFRTRVQVNLNYKIHTHVADKGKQINNVTARDKQ